MTNQKVTQIQVGFHYGRTLLHLADTYARPLQVILEMIQNAIDAEATSILVKIDGRRKLIFCADDGKGEDFEGIQARFQHISEQQKQGKMGHKGIGNLASLAISGGFLLTSRPRLPFSRERYFTFELSREGLEGMADKVILGCKRQPKDFRPGSAYKLGTDFAISTLIIARNVNNTALRQLKDAVTIAQAIEGRFAPQILDKKIRVFIEAGSQRILAEPAAFPGEPQIAAIQTGYGTVRFVIYLNTKPVKKPRLSVVHGKTKAEQSALPLYRDLLVEDAAKEVFESGYFQGDIYVPFGTLAPNRLEFIHDPELADLWGALGEYARSYGRPLLQRIAEEKKESKTQHVLLSALKKLEQYLAKHPDLRTLFKGLVSEGHFEAEDGSEKGKGRTHPSTKRAPRQRQDEQREPPSREQKGRTHSIVINSGSQRRAIRGQIGIQVTWRDPNPEEGRDWCSKREGSVIVFNSLHPFWQRVEPNPEAHTSYCYYLLAKEVCLTSLHPESQASFNECFENSYLPVLVEGISK